MGGFFVGGFFVCFLLQFLILLIFENLFLTNFTKFPGLFLLYSPIFCEVHIASPPTPRPPRPGIIDPTKVVRTALVDAASVAGLMITTEATIVTAEDDDKDAQGCLGLPGTLRGQRFLKVGDPGGWEAGKVLPPRCFYFNYYFFPSYSSSSSYFIYFNFGMAPKILGQK